MNSSCPDGGEETFVLCRSRERREKEQAMHARFERRIEEGLAKIAAARIRADEQGAAQITWTKVERWRTWSQLSDGAYVLRTNLRDWNDKDLWRAYTQLTDAEAAFRIQKSDLSLRPVWHQKEDRVLAHILVCFLAYVLWKFLGQLCQRAGLGDEPRRVLAELAELRVVDVVLPTRDGPDIRTCCVTQPSEHQQILLQHLGLAIPSRLRRSDL